MEGVTLRDVEGMQHAGVWGGCGAGGEEAGGGCREDGRVGREIWGLEGL